MISGLDASTSGLSCEGCKWIEAAPDDPLLAGAVPAVGGVAQVVRATVS